STTTWCLTPGRPRSVGFAPLSSTPPSARVVALSMAARDQSRRSACCRRASRVATRRAPTPARVHSLQRAHAAQAGPDAPPLGEVLPGDAGLQDEQDAGQRLAVVQRLAAGKAKAARLGRRQERFDLRPQIVG